MTLFNTQNLPCWLVKETFIANNSQYQVYDSRCHDSWEKTDYCLINNLTNYDCRSRWYSGK